MIVRLPSCYLCAAPVTTPIHPIRRSYQLLRCRGCELDLCLRIANDPERGDRLAARLAHDAGRVFGESLLGRAIIDGSPPYRRTGTS